MKKKYKVYPAYIHSINDNDIHYIPFFKLCRLYGVNPAECLDMSRPDNIYGMTEEAQSNLIPLRVCLHSHQYETIKNQLKQN